MKKPDTTKVIAVTGGIGSGKSLLARYAEKHGACIIDTDILSRELQADGTVAAQRIRAAFGDKVYAGGQLDRKLLGEIVFSDKEKLNTLNSIMHPLIIDELKTRIGAAKRRGEKTVIALIPLLFESGHNAAGFCDEIWIVDAPESDCIRRIMQRDNCTVEYAKLRIAAQMSFLERAAAAKKTKTPAKVVKNDAGVDKLYLQIDALLQQ